MLLIFCIYICLSETLKLRELQLSFYIGETGLHLAIFTRLTYRLAERPGSTIPTTEYVENNRHPPSSWLVAEKSGVVLFFTRVSDFWDGRQYVATV